MKFVPEVKDVSVRDIIRGEAFGGKPIWLPTVQRDFVWSERRVADFFDSLYNGYPVGAITIIRTNHEFPKVPFEDNQIEDKGGERYYVLDGQQRLTSLYLLKNVTKSGKWYIKRGNKEINRTYIGCNPDEKIVKFEVRRGNDIANIIRKLAKNEPFDFKDEDKRRKLIEIADKILNYKLPVVYIDLSIDSNDDEGEIYEKIANMFVRINSGGMRLGSIEMFFSFFAGSYDEIKRKIQEMYEKLSNKYDIDPEPFLRVIFWSFGIDQSDFTARNFKRALNKIKEKYNESEESKREMIEKINKCYNSVEKTIEFLNETLGINKDIIRRYLPSQNVMVPLFAYVFKNNGEIPKESREKMIAWFILASFYSAYSQSTNTKIQEDLEKIDEAKKGDFPLKGIKLPRKKRVVTSIDEDDIMYYANPEDYNPELKQGKNYLFLIYVLLNLNNASDFEGRSIKDCEKLEVHHIFPRSLVDDEKISEDDINDFANRTFISESANIKISEDLPENYLKNYNKADLQKHFIPSDESLYKVDKFVDFLNERSELIYSAVKKYVNDVLRK